MTASKTPFQGSPPYVPFKTLLSTLEGMENAIPSQLDRSLWPSYSGATQSQILAALRFLHLIDEKGHPSESLHALVDPSTRKAKLAELLKAAYPDVFAKDPQRMSRKQLRDIIRSFGISGSTLDRAVAFFIHAASYAGIPLSPRLTAGTRQSRVARKPRSLNTVRPSTGFSRHTPEDSSQKPDSGANSVTVKLQSGGSVTLVVDASLVTMSDTEINFVKGLLRLMREYKGEKETADDQNQ